MEQETALRSNQRIVFVNRFFYPDISATSQVLSEIAFALSTAGKRVIIVTGLSSYQNPSHRYLPIEKIGDVEIIRIAKSRFGRLNYVGRIFDLFWFYFLVIFKLLFLIKKEDILICKTDPPLLVVIGAIIKKIKKCQLICWNQDLFPEVAESFFNSVSKQYIYRFLLNVRNRALKQCDQCVVISEAMANNIKSFGVDLIKVIPNWGKKLNVESLDTKLLKKEWELATKFVIEYSGNFGFAHEYDTIEKFVNESKDDSDLVFLFIGSGRGIETLKQFVKTHKIQNVLFKPYQPEEKLAASLSVADIHLITLKPEMEGLVFPSKFYNICAASKPVLFIGNQTAELAQLITANQCGRSFSPNQVSEIVKYVNQLKSNYEILPPMGRNARKLYEDNYTLEQTLERWIRLLTAL